MYYLQSLLRSGRVVPSGWRSPEGAVTAVWWSAGGSSGGVAHNIMCSTYVIWRMRERYEGTPTPRPFRNVRSPTLNLYKPKTACPTSYCPIWRRAVNWSEHTNRITRRSHGVHCEYKLLPECLNMNNNIICIILYNDKVSWCWCGVLYRCLQPKLILFLEFLSRIS